MPFEHLRKPRPTVESFTSTVFEVGQTAEYFAKRINSWYKVVIKEIDVVGVGNVEKGIVINARIEFENMDEIRIPFSELHEEGTGKIEERQHKREI